MSTTPTTNPDRAWKLLEQTDWCKRSYARDRFDCPTDLNDPSACRFCMVGAIRRVYPATSVQNILAKIKDKLFNNATNHISTVFLWNDASVRTKDQVISLLKELDI